MTSVTISDGPPRDIFAQTSSRGLETRKKDYNSGFVCLTRGDVEAGCSIKIVDFRLALPSSLSTVCSEVVASRILWFTASRVFRTRRELCLPTTAIYTSSRLLCQLCKYTVKTVAINGSTFVLLLGDAVYRAHHHFTLQLPSNLVLIHHAAIRDDQKETCQPSCRPFDRVFMHT